MNAPSLFDLAPVVRLLLLALVVALGPLAWVWLRSPGAPMAARLRALTLITLFLTFDLVLFGAFTRLSDSGLGCPDWPGCYGNVSPLGARHAIGAAQAALPSGPVTWSKAWIEMTHRYLAMGVGVLIVVLALVSWLQRKRLAVPLVLPLATLVWVCVQGAFGALTVTMKLFPLIVTLHLLGALVLLVLLRAQATGYALAAPDSPGRTELSRGQRWALLLVFALVWLQIALGGWVSTNYAVLACNGFPQCQGSWWPDMDLRAGFTLWRGLGLDGAGDAIPFAALTAIHLVHRLCALLVFVALGWLAWRLWAVPRLQGTARALLALALWQFASGLSNVVLDWPLVAALAHTGGAAGLVLVLSDAVFKTRSAAARLSAPAFNSPRPIR